MVSELQSKIDQLLKTNFDNANKDDTISLIKDIQRLAIEEKTGAADRKYINNALALAWSPLGSLKSNTQVTASKIKRSYLNFRKEDATEIYEGLKSFCKDQGKESIDQSDIKTLSEQDSIIGQFFKIIVAWLKMRLAQAKISQEHKSDIEDLSGKTIDDLKVLAVKYKTQLTSANQSYEDAKKLIAGKMYTKKQVLYPEKTNNPILKEKSDKYLECGRIQNEVNLIDYYIKSKEFNEAVNKRATRKFVERIKDKVNIQGQVI